MTQRKKEKIVSRTSWQKGAILNSGPLLNPSTGGEHTPRLSQSLSVASLTFLSRITRDVTTDDGKTRGRPLGLSAVMLAPLSMGRQPHSATGTPLDLKTTGDGV